MERGGQIMKIVFGFPMMECKDCGSMWFYATDEQAKGFANTVIYGHPEGRAGIARDKAEWLEKQRMVGKVKAMIYKVECTDGGIGMVHGFTMSVSEIFIPELELCVNVTGGLNVFREYKPRSKNTVDIWVDDKFKEPLENYISLKEELIASFTDMIGENIEKVEFKSSDSELKAIQDNEWREKKRWG